MGHDKPAEIIPLPPLERHPDRPDVPWIVHMGMQSEFAKLVAALGVTVVHNTPFADSVAQCHARARAASAKADQYEAVLSLVDSAEDAIGLALTLAGKDPQMTKDLNRARTLLKRALPLLRELVEKK